MEPPTFDPTRMRFARRTRKPYPGTKVLITGTSKNGNFGVVVEESCPELKPRIPVKIGGCVFGFYSHQVIEILV